MKYAILSAAAFLAVPLFAFAHAGKDEFAHHSMAGWQSGMMGRGFWPGIMLFAWIFCLDCLAGCWRIGCNLALAAD